MAIKLPGGGAGFSTIKFNAKLSAAAATSNQFKPIKNIVGIIEKEVAGKKRYIKEGGFNAALQKKAISEIKTEAKKTGVKYLTAIQKKDIKTIMSGLGSIQQKTGGPITPVYQKGAKVTIEHETATVGSIGDTVNVRKSGQERAGIVGSVADLAKKGGPTSPAGSTPPSSNLNSNFKLSR